MKRTLYFGNPAYLSCRLDQLLVDRRAEKGIPEDTPIQSVPLEDVGLIVLDHKQITLTHATLQACNERNIALLSCSSNHMPGGLMQPFFGHTRHRAILEAQLESSKPLRKQLWAQTVQAKLRNQAAVMQHFERPFVPLELWASKVRSGDEGNLEARGAAHYWKFFLDKKGAFFREPEGPPPNDWLNYGYSILRALVARALVGSGLLPAWGLFHRNKYNPFCLADDIMEPFRPWADALVLDMLRRGFALEPLRKSIKFELLGIPQADAKTSLGLRPLQLAIEQSTASLAQCFLGESKRLIYPQWITTA